MKTITAEIPCFITCDSLTPSDLLEMEPEDAVGCGNLSYYKTEIDGWFRAGKAQITITLNDDNEVIKDMVSSIDRQQKTIQADAEFQVNRLEQKKQQLLAIEYKG